MDFIAKFVNSRTTFILIFVFLYVKKNLLSN